MRLTARGRLLKESVSGSASRHAEHYRLLFEHIPVACVVLDARGTIMEANGAATSLLGTEALPLNGMPFGTFLHGTEKVAFTRHIDRCLLEGATVETFLMLDVRGVPMFTHMLSNYRRGKPGDPIEILTSLNDITLFRENSRKHRAPEEVFRAAVEDTPLTLFHQDLELRYEWVHAARSNVRLASAVGKTDSALFSPKAAEHLTDIKRWVLGHGVARHDLVEVSFGEKEEGFTDLTLFPRFAGMNTLIGIRGVAFDVTPVAEEMVRRCQKK